MGPKYYPHSKAAEGEASSVIILIDVTGMCMFGTPPSQHWALHIGPMALHEQEPDLASRDLDEGSIVEGMYNRAGQHVSATCCHVLVTFFSLFLGAFDLSP